MCYTYGQKYFRINRYFRSGQVIRPATFSPVSSLQLATGYSETTVSFWLYSQQGIKVCSIDISLINAWKCKSLLGKLPMS